MAEETTQTTTQTATESTSPVKTDGSFVENWNDKYGEENKAHLSRYKNFDEFVTSHVSQRKKFSKDPSTLVEIPNEHSSDDVRAAFRKASGVPETVDGYEYTLSDELAVKLGPLDDTKMTAFREFANKQGWNPTQFKDALDFYHNNTAADIDAAGISLNEQNAATAAASKAELMKQSGWQTEVEYQNKVQRVQSVMEKYGGVDAVAELNLQNSPTLIKFLDNIAESMSEDTLKGLKGSPGVTKDNLKSQITDIRSQMDVIMKENPSNYKGNDKFRDLQRRKTELYKQYPS